MVYGGTPSGDPNINLGLRHSFNHKWYYYPNMTNDEVLAFKQFEHTKGVPYTKVNTCFHTAFTDPTAPENAEKRTSSEYRVWMYFS